MATKKTWTEKLNCDKKPKIKRIDFRRRSNEF